jgi:heptosyltransferase-2
VLSERPAILIARFSSLGDVVMATAAARYIKTRWPEATVRFATKAAFAPILEGQPDIDDVWTLGEDGLGGIVRRAEAAGINGYLDLHANIRSRVLELRLNVPRTRRWKSMGLNRRLRVSAPFLKPYEPPPVVRRYVEAAAALMGEAPSGDTPLPRLAVGPDAREWATGWLAGQGLREGQKLLAVAPGAAWPTKRWGVDHLAQTLSMVSEFDKVRFVLLGSPAEGELVRSVKAAMKKGAENAFVACDETKDLRRLAALIAASQGFLGHDSGPMHVAEALGVPITVLFGPTVRAFGFYPQGPGHRVFERELDCRPCSVHGSAKCPLGHHACLEGIEPFDVSRHLRLQLGLEAA